MVFANFNHIDMVQIVPQTKEEKIAMYMKCTKKELAEMLWACNVLIDQQGVKVSFKVDRTIPKIHVDEH